MDIFKRTEEHPFSIFDKFIFGFFIGGFGILFFNVYFLL